MRSLRRLSPRSRRLVLVGVTLALVWGGRALREWRAPDTATGPGDPSAHGGTKIATAFREERSGLMVEAEGRLERLLSDDLEGSRHQRAVVRLDSGLTVLLSHNIDLAPRVPWAVADRVAFRGQYEWNERGGVVHWTHHDPEGRRTGGWIDHRGRTYR